MRVHCNLVCFHLSGNESFYGVAKFQLLIKLMEHCAQGIEIYNELPKWRIVSYFMY